LFADIEAIRSEFKAVLKLSQNPFTREMSGSSAWSSSKRYDPRRGWSEVTPVPAGKVAVKEL
jgi:hypothetical protein